ncbi:MAG: hypothetical protein ACI4UM_02610 [Succinivibrio sp.]
MKKLITAMMLHVNENECKKDDRGTITGFKPNISSKILDKLIPWNMA